MQQSTMQQLKVSHINCLHTLAMHGKIEKTGSHSLASVVKLNSAADHAVHATHAAIAVADAVHHVVDAAHHAAPHVVTHVAHHATLLAVAPVFVAAAKHAHSILGAYGLSLA